MYLNIYIVSMRTRRRAKIEAGLYTKLTVVGVLYGDVIYAVKALDNIKILKQMFVGLNIVLYYDHTVSEDFLRHAKAVGGVRLIFVRHAIGKGIMLSRLVHLDVRPTEYTVMIDIHNELPQQRCFNVAVESSLKRTENGEDFLQLMCAPYAAHLAKAVYGPDRFPPLVIDAGGVGISQNARMKSTVEDEISTFLNEYTYTYGDDEWVLDKWVSHTYPGWFKGGHTEVQLVPSDGENDMDLGGLIVLDPRPVGIHRGEGFSDEVLDWTRFNLGAKRTNLATNTKPERVSNFGRALRN
jgi:hypothetical protein